MAEFIKICGITRLEDALEAASLGVRILGFIFTDSPRLVQADQARAITSKLPSTVKKVGVFSNQDLEYVQDIADFCSLDLIQLHGEETPEYCSALSLPVIKGFRVKNRESLEYLREYNVFAYLLDSYSEKQLGGTGKTFDWSLVHLVREYGRIVLAGGLKPENVGKAIREVNPYGLDICSGVEESPGKKDIGKIKKLLENIRSEENATR